jgi:hypothetical protein
MKDDSSLINLDFLILILIIIVVVLFIGKFFTSQLFNEYNLLSKKKYKTCNISDSDSFENYGNLSNNPAMNNNSSLDYQLISNNNASKIIDKNDASFITSNIDENIPTQLSNNYNNMNNLPYLVDPKNTGKGFLNNKVKLVENPNSPLLKLDTKYKKQINQKINTCSNTKQFYDGYNKYNDLRKVNYANVTSIGKNLIVPYTSFPVAS